jgi:glutamate formiminotransferase / 5-formyltetrahydrofolate cyclo-ligase
MKIIECVPNFSEGRNRSVVESIVSAVHDLPGITIMDCSMDADHNRSVLTFIGSPENVLAGAVAACNRAVELIDMRRHEGEHPRIGAVDVVPFIPFGSAQMADAVDIAHRFGKTFSARNSIPVYFYGEAALHEKRKRLSDIRRGGYERFKEKIREPLWKPDAGSGAFNEKSGATAVGARIPLIAFNINLDTDDIGIAKAIACEIRTSGGGLPCLKAIGVQLKTRKLAQVSMNLTDYRTTSLRTVFDVVNKKAQSQGAGILESELIGLIPQAALKGVTPEHLKLAEFSDKKIIENWITSSSQGTS